MVPLRFRNLDQRVTWRLIGIILITGVVAIAFPASRVSFSASVPTVPAAFERLPPSSATTKHQGPDVVPGELLVRFRSDAVAVDKLGLRSETVVTEASRQIPVQLERLTEGPELVEGLRLARVAPEDAQSVITGLRSRPDVIYVEPNFIRRKATVPNDTRYTEQWALKNTGQFGPPGNDIRAETAWDITTGSRSIVVGVVDEGIDINHPDLKDNVWNNPAEISGNGIDDDGNGFVDDVNGWDFAHDDNTVFDYALPSYPPPDNYALDVDDHGTHVSGIIGALGNNANGVTGVNWHVSLLPLKFLGPMGGSSANLLKALSYAKVMRELWTSSGGAKGANIRVLNNSYGGFGFSQAELDAINSLAVSNIMFVAAAGNAKLNNDLIPEYPASYPAANIISVGATGLSDAVASFSNFGTSVHLSAPGVGILSTTPHSTYFFGSGTSEAAPHVAGAAALLYAAHPQVSLDAMRSALIYNGKQIDNQWSLSGRRLDLYASLQALAENDITAPAAITDFRVNFQTRQSVFLRWTAPGDDANAGRATLYEIRFSDAPFADEQAFAQARSLIRVFPLQAGGAEQANVQIPYRHASGFIGIRAVDNVGNKGAIASVSVSDDLVYADPYTIQESASQTLSTGGTALGIKGDDTFKDYVLPFNSDFFNNTIDRVTISSNGAIYVPIPNASSVPVGDFPGELISLRALERKALIAGLWDDLRTDRRVGDDVYVIGPDFQHPDRIIFRWQAVTYDTPTGPGTSRGENPVNFEIELRRDGTVITRYGDGNQKVLPIVGVSAGFDPYVVNSHTSESLLKDLTNAPAVTFSLRLPTAPQLRLTLATSSTIISGQELAYSALATNSGPSVAENSVLDVTLSPGQTFLSCSGGFACQGPPPGTNGGIVRVNFGALGVRNSGEVQIRVRVTAGSGSEPSASGKLSCARADVLPAFANAISKVVGDIFYSVPFTGASQIDSEGSHTVALRNGMAWGWGHNFYGQLGDGTKLNRGYAVQTQNLSSIVSIAAGRHFSMALRSDGTVWTWGDNEWGQLGNGSASTTQSSVPVQVVNLSGVVAISAGSSHALALRSDGSVWAWGANSSGELGGGSTDFAKHPEPRPVSGVANISAIAAGSNYSIVIDRGDGSLWAWGSNVNGRLGDGTTTARSSPVRVVGVSQVKSISPGELHCAVVTNDSSVWTWGFNRWGQLGLGTSDLNPHLIPVKVPSLQAIAVAVGYGHTMAVKPDGTVWAWGYNSQGQLGNGNADFGQVQPPHPEITQVSGLSNALAVAAGDEFSLALINDSSGTTVKAWGSNSFSNLGDGTREFRPRPVTVIEDALAAPNSPNAIDSTSPFVRQHYLDFLNREPDAAGLQFWINNIDSCGLDLGCREVKRIDTSAAYFLSIEFQETGYLVHRFYKASFGRRPLFTEFLADTQKIGKGVIVNAPGWQQLLENNKQNFAGDITTRPLFKSLYDILNNSGYVNTLISNSGASFSQPERDAMVNSLNASTRTRAQVLRQIVENQGFYNAEYNTAFVEMQYFGYLRRNPQDAPDNNLDGYNFWLNKLNEFSGDYRKAEMVKAFLVSTEFAGASGRREDLSLRPVPLVQE